MQQAGSDTTPISICKRLFRLVQWHDWSLHACPCKWYIDTNGWHGKLYTMYTMIFQEP